MTCQTIEGLSDSANYLQQMLPGIPLKVLKDRYSEVLIDFAKETEIWRYVFERLPVFKDTKVYELDKHVGQTVHRIVDVFVAEGCGCDTEFKIPEGQGVQRGSYQGSSINQSYSRNDYDGNRSRSDSFGGSNARDQWWYSSEPNKLMFNECFCDDGCLRLELVLRPERGTTNFPPDLLDKYKEVIEFGVLAKAMMMPKQEWTDKKEALFYKGEFEDGKKEPKRKHKNNMLHGRPAYRNRNRIL